MVIPGICIGRTIFRCDAASAEVKAFLLLLALCRAVVKEVVKSSEFIQDVPPPQSCQCRALHIVTEFGRHTAMRYGAWFGLCKPLEVPQLRHTYGASGPELKDEKEILVMTSTRSVYHIFLWRIYLNIEKDRDIIFICPTMASMSARAASRGLHGDLLPSTSQLWSICFQL